MMKFLIFSLCCAVFFVLEEIEPANGHGMVWNPAHRGSRWRFQKSAPHNYDDNGLFCGGKETQHNIHGGKCGICGDNYGTKTPRPHEMGGKYGQGIPTGTYTQGSTIKIIVKITANHKGYFVFDICNLDHQNETEECFNEKVFTPDRENFVLPSEESKKFTVFLKLPEHLICEHCVLRWTYHTANSWGNCGNGKGAVGCGPQETFRTCSDITIKKSDSKIKFELDIDDGLETETESVGRDDQKPKKKPHNKKDKTFPKNLQGKLKKSLSDLKVSLKNLETNIKKVQNLLNEIPESTQVDLG